MNKMEAEGRRWDSALLGIVGSRSEGGAHSQWGAHAIKGRLQSRCPITAKSIISSK